MGEGHVASKVRETHGGEIDALGAVEHAVCRYVIGPSGRGGELVSFVSLVVFFENLDVGGAGGTVLLYVRKLRSRTNDRADSHNESDIYRHPFLISRPAYDT